MSNEEDVKRNYGLCFLLLEFGFKISPGPGPGVSSNFTREKASALHFTSTYVILPGTKNDRLVI